MAELTARIHSVETLGAVDGPGIRFVIFFQGCPLRCLYCHNPDTWNPEEGRVVTVSELMAEAGRYRSYMRASGGGVTASGGEPLLQADFIAAFFERCREKGIHTALDTSGCINLTQAAPALMQTDLVLLDFKAFDPEKFQKLTGMPMENLIKTCNFLENRRIPARLRFVVVPGLTDDMNEIRGMAHYLSGFANIERVELIPFHKMGEYKWRELGLSYSLTDTPTPHPEVMRQAREIFLEAGLNAI